MGELRAADLAAVDVDGLDLTVNRWSAVPTTRDPLLEAVDLHGAHDFRHTCATWLEGGVMGARYRHTTPERPCASSTPSTGG